MAIPIQSNKNNPDKERTTAINKLFFTHN
jgi:hypothetical protein